jgi:hypothetical protein
MTVSHVLDWHTVAAWALIIVNGVAGVWALAAHRFEPLRGRLVWGVVVVGQLLTFVQALLGVLLVTRFDLVLEQFHALYGFSTIIAVGILYSYRTSPFMEGKALLLYGFGCLFIMGLGIRNLGW